MANISLIKDQDILQFATKLLILLGVLFLADLFGLSVLTLLISIAGNGALIYFSWGIFKDFNSDFPKAFLLSAILSIFGEICILANMNHTKTSRTFWLILALYFGRNILLSAKLLHNILNSHIYNYFWVRVLPFPCIGLLFILLEIFIFGKETDHFFVFLLYNVIVCLPLLLSALRNNHTSYSGYFIMLIGNLALLTSDIFYFLQIVGDPTQGVSFGFRATFLLIGNAFILFATYDHVTEFEKEARKIYYFGITEEEMSKVRGKFTKNPNKPLQEPLI